MNFDGTRAYAVVARSFAASLLISSWYVIMILIALSLKSLGGGGGGGGGGGKYSAVAMSALTKILNCIEFLKVVPVGLGRVEPVQG